MHRVANTVLSVANQSDPLIKVIVDRTENIDLDFIEQVLGLPQFSWHGRRPRGSAAGHNLDLFSVLVELARRQAHVRLHGYDNMLPYSVTAGEYRVGTSFPHGELTRLVSHSEHLSLSLVINDRSIVRPSASGSKVGAERTYSIVGYDGAWRDGWYGLSWDHSEDEAKFFGHYGLSCEGQVEFRDFLHFERRKSIFSRAYLLLKALWQRLMEEAAHCRAEMTRLEGIGVGAPKGLRLPGRQILAKGQSRNIFVPCFVMKLDGLNYIGEFTAVSDDEDGYRTAYYRHGEIMQELLPLVQFVMRADEVAFYLHGCERGYVAPWIKGPLWQPTEDSWFKLQITDTLSLSYYTDRVPVAVAV